jgi:hypothetical protein
LKSSSQKDWKVSNNEAKRTAFVSSCGIPLKTSILPPPTKRPNVLESIAKVLSGGTIKKMRYELATPFNLIDMTPQCVIK